jgi:hypothetical protein
MRLQKVIQGRCITDANMASIKSLLDNKPDWNRCRLSRELCQRWNWQNQKGRLKDMAPTLLLKLERSGPKDIFVYPLHSDFHRRLCA